MAFTSTSLRTGFGAGFVAASSAALSQVADSLLLYSVKGENSLQPSGPSNNAISRFFIWRKLYLTGIETTLS